MVIRLVTAVRILAKATLVLILTLLFLVVTLLLVVHELPFMGKRFDAEAWTTSDSCEELTVRDCAWTHGECTKRAPMVRNLVRNHLIVDRTTRETVTALLGPKEYSVSAHGRSCEGYVLGMCSGLRIDYDSLYVCYGKNGTVSAAGQIQH